MSEEEVLEAKRLRGAARSVFETQREMVRADLGAAGVGKRVATRLVDDGRMIAEEAADAASTHKTLLTLGALGLTGWFLRGPIMAFAGNLLGYGDEGDDERLDPAAPASDAEPE